MQWNDDSSKEKQSKARMALILGVSILLVVLAIALLYSMVDAQIVEPMPTMIATSGVVAVTPTPTIPVEFPVIFTNSLWIPVVMR